MTGIRSELVDNLQQGQEALETAGYETEGYKIRINSDAAEPGIAGSGETPEEAIDQLMTEVDSEENFFIHLAGDEVNGLIQGEEDPEELIYRNITGAVEIDEPDVPETFGGTDIQYIPGSESQWKIDTYDVEDGQQRAEDAATALQEYGLEAEIGHIHP